MRQARHPEGVRFAAVAASAFVCLAGLGQARITSRTPDELAAVGERLYMRGVSVSGEPLQATVQGDLRVRSTDMPCANCHRRSAWGTAEGPITVPAVVGAVLFEPVTQGAPQMGAPRATGAGTRPAYSDAGLLRAVRHGVDPAGRTLSPTMPRYDVSEQDATALAAYLRSLSTRTPAGVTDSTVHLATIVTDGVDAGRRASLLEVLRTYVRVKNGGTRNETRRRERGPWDMQQYYENYRTWVLHEWELHGSPREWAVQLEALYAREPVFAIVSGVADGDWSPVDEFAGRFEVPVILPQTPLPPGEETEGGFYTLYFSRALRVETKALARHLDTAAPAKRVQQVSRCGTAGEVAARALTQAVPLSSAVRSECVEAGVSLTAAAWQTLLSRETDTLVVWLGRDDLDALRALVAEPTALAGVSEIYLSSSLLGDEALRLPAALSARAMLVHPLVAPDEFDRHAWRALVWLKANGITPADRPVAVNAFYAATLVADALSVPRTLGSREYFVERIEHMAGRSPNPSAFPSISFGPGRRFGSTGCFVLKMPASPGGVFRKVEPWFVPQL